MIQESGLFFEPGGTEEDVLFVLIPQGGNLEYRPTASYIFDFIRKVNFFLHCAQKYGFCWQRLRKYANLNASKFHYVFLETEHVSPRAHDEGTLLTMLKMLQRAHSP